MNLVKKLSSILVVLSLVLANIVVSVQAEDNTGDAFERIQGMGYFTNVTDPDEKMQKTDFFDYMKAVTTTDYSSQFEPTVYVKCAEAVKFFVIAAGYENLARDAGGYPAGYMTYGQKLELLSGLPINSAELITYRQFAKIAVNAFDVEMYKIESWQNGYPQYSSSPDKTFLSEMMDLKLVKGQITASSITSIDPSGNAPERSIKIDGVEYYLNDDTMYLANMVGYFVEAYISLADEDENTVRQAVLDSRSEIITIPAEDIIEYDDYVLKYDVSSEGKRSSKNVKIPRTAQVIYNGQVTGSYTSDMFDIENGEVILIYDKAHALSTVIVKSYVDYVIGVIDYKEKIVYNKLSVSEDDKILDLDEMAYDGNLVIKDINEQPYLFDDLKEGDVLSVLKNDAYLEVYVSTNLMQNVSLTAINNYDGDTYTTFEDKEYKVSRYFAATEDFNTIEMGRSYNVSLNAFGKIAYVNVKKGSGLNQAAFVGLLTYINSDTGEDTMAMKVFGADGVMKKVEFADKVTLNDQYGGSTVYKKNFDKLYTAMRPYKGLLWYSVDSEGKVNKVEFALDEYNPALPNRIYKIKLLYGQQDRHYVYKQSTRTFGGQYYMTSDCVLYNIPYNDDGIDDTEHDDEEYKIITAGSLVNRDIQYKMYGYSSDEDGVMLSSIIFPLQNGLSSKDNFKVKGIIVTDVMTGMNSDGEDITRVIGVEDGTKVTYDSLGHGNSAFDNAKSLLDPTKTYQIKQGDIIRVQMDGEVVDNCQLLYRYDIINPAHPDGKKGCLVDSTGKPELISDAGNGNPFGIYDGKLQGGKNNLNFGSAEYHVYYGWVYKKNGSIITLTTQDLSTNAFDRDLVTSKNDYLESYNINAFSKFSVMDLSGKRIEATQGTADDIRAYKDVGSECSRVIATTYYGEMRQLIVIND